MGHARLAVCHLLLGNGISVNPLSPSGMFFSAWFQVIRQLAIGNVWKTSYVSRRTFDRFIWRA
jgi:hypothetical protein